MEYPCAHNNFEECIYCYHELFALMVRTVDTHNLEKLALIVSEDNMLWLPLEWAIADREYEEAMENGGFE